MSDDVVFNIQSKEGYSIQRICSVLNITRSRIYQHHRVNQQPISPERVRLNQQIKDIFKSSGKNYGSRRVQQALIAKGVKISRYKARKLMKQEGLVATWTKAFIHAKKSKTKVNIADNVLDQQFNPEKPNQAWVADITYIRTGSGWLYLAAVMDLYSRKIVGYSMSKHMTADLVCTALQLAIQTRQPPVGLIMHTDQGSQYCSNQYQHLLNRHQIRCSMSHKGLCYDNAVMERFFLNLKMERVWQQYYANHQEAIRDVSHYITVFYNQVRLHSTLNYQTPNQFEQNIDNLPSELSEFT